ncbi:MAG: ketopantoate reductase family protein [Kiritimatiellae bacterium]|nr:ketopantoate reductase family protein [Kiritimatiellia bacterium]
MPDTTKKRVAVLGAGGIGGAIAGYLAHAGTGVTVIDPWPEHVMAMKEDGLRIEDVRGGFTVPVTALHIGEVSGVADPFDIVVLSFKSYDTVWATHLIAPHLAASGVVLPAQNGMNDETVAGIVGPERTMGFVPLFSAAVYEPGHVVRTDNMDYPPFLIGEIDGADTPRLREAAALLNAITPAGDIAGDIPAVRWTKFTFNCMVNALAGILGDQPGPMSEEQKSWTTLIKILIGAEVVRTAQALGITTRPFKGMPAITREDLLQARSRADLERLRDKVHAAGKRRNGRAKPSGPGGPPGHGRPRRPPYSRPAQSAHLSQNADEPPRKLSVRGRASFLQDVVKGRKVEIEALNGYAVRKGRETGIPTPMNAAICAVVARIERGETAPGPHNIETLSHALPDA